MTPRDGNAANRSNNQEHREHRRRPECQQTLQAQPNEQGTRQRHRAEVHQPAPVQSDGHVIGQHQTALVQQALETNPLLQLGTQVQGYVNLVANLLHRLQPNFIKLPEGVIKVYIQNLNVNFHGRRDDDPPAPTNQHNNGGRKGKLTCWIIWLAIGLILTVVWTGLGYQHHHSPDAQPRQPGILIMPKLPTAAQKFSTIEPLYPRTIKSLWAGPHTSESHLRELASRTVSASDQTKTAYDDSTNSLYRLNSITAKAFHKARITAYHENRRHHSTFPLLLFDYAFWLFLESRSKSFAKPSNNLAIELADILLTYLRSFDKDAYIESLAQWFSATNNTHQALSLVLETSVQQGEEHLRKPVGKRKGSSSKLVTDKTKEFEVLEGAIEHLCGNRRALEG
ncbi:MAG: hypothetical protein Q9218_007993, partial [Villophora microphyllina]